jgi:Gnt-I system low-affinity gluconate transporter
LIRIGRNWYSISLLISSFAVGLLAGLNGTEIIKTIQIGMGGNLGFVATVVGSGAMFGTILEHLGGNSAISGFLLQKLGKKKAPLALLLPGWPL